MEIVIKSFSDLTIFELYQLLRLRSEVFVVEQNCIYQDIDDKDKKAFHVMGFEGDELVAYTRFFRPGDYFEKASLGRVAVPKASRDSGFGRQIIAATIEQMELNDKIEQIEISAQVYLKGFYEDFYFSIVGEDYLEDGIPHIKMVRHVKS